MIFKEIRAGEVNCDDGVVVRLHRQHISYIKDKSSIAVEIEYMADGKLVVYGGHMEQQNPYCNQYISPEEQARVLERIREVLIFWGHNFEIESL